MLSLTCWSLSVVLEFRGSRIVPTGVRKAQSHMPQIVKKFPAKPQRRKENRKEMQSCRLPLRLCCVCVSFSLLLLCITVAGEHGPGCVTITMLTAWRGTDRGSSSSTSAGHGLSEMRMRAFSELRSGSKTFAPPRVPNRMRKLKRSRLGEFRSERMPTKSVTGSNSQNPLRLMYLT